MQSQEISKDTQETNEDSKPVDAINSPSVSILSLPARSEADEIAAMMLAQVLETKGCVVQALPVTSLASEMVEVVERRKADVVCISATPPGAMMHARYLCKQIRRRCPKVKLVVGLWAFQGDVNKAKERIGCAATVVTTLTDAQEQIRVFMQEFLSKAEQKAPTHGDGMVVERAHPSNYPSQVAVQSTLQLGR
jgi:hypothetical protein